MIDSIVVIERVLVPNMDESNRTKLRDAASEGGRYGLVASGTGGEWSVDIDETTSGEQNWFAQIEGPSLYLHFEIVHPRIVSELLSFLSARPRITVDSGIPWDEASDTLRIGSFNQSPVTLVRDDEFPDRWFISLGEGHCRLQYTLTGDDCAGLIQALQQVNADLVADGS
jgi:hypothetical protein